MPPVRLSTDHADGITDVVVDLSTGAPTILYWGRSLGSDVDLDTVAHALERPIVHGTFDVVAPITMVPEHGSGFVGRPGLSGRRGGGRAWAPRFVTTSHEVVGNHLVVDAADEVAGLALRTTITLAETLRVWAELTNTADRRYSLDGLTVTMPLPHHGPALMTF